MLDLVADVIRNKLLTLNALPFVILLLPLAGFVVLALFGDWIKRDHEEAGAGTLACFTVLSSFGLSAWATFRLYGLSGVYRAACPSSSPTWASSGSRRAAFASR